MGLGRGAKLSTASGASSTSKFAQPKVPGSHKGRVNFGGVTYRVPTGPKGKDPPTRVLGGQLVKNKSGHEVLATTHKGKGPLDGGPVPRKTLVSRKGKMPQKLSVPGQSARGGVTAARTPPVVALSSASRKRFLASASAGSLPRKRVQTAATSNRRNQIRPTRKPAIGGGGSNNSGSPVAADIHHSPREPLPLVVSTASVCSPNMELDRDTSSQEPAAGVELDRRKRSLASVETATVTSAPATNCSGSPTEHNERLKGSVSDIMMESVSPSILEPATVTQTLTPSRQPESLSATPNSMVTHEAVTAASRTHQGQDGAIEDLEMWTR